MSRQSLQTRVSAVMVTWNSGADVLAALGSLRMQSLPVFELIVVDNASEDASLKRVRRYWPEAVILRNETNLGFARAANQGIDAARGEAVLLVNPDTELETEFLARLLNALEYREDVAVACGKLLRFETKKGRPIIDSAGMRMTRDLRHLDRGAGEPDRGRYDCPAFVFGASGAAFLAKKSHLNRVRVDGRIFDESFHSYREDADLAWRLQLAGFACLYEPRAVGRHRRRVTPERRRALPDWINRNSVRNRFYLKMNNLTGPVLRKTALPSLVRDLLVVGACLTVEPQSRAGLVEAVKAVPERLHRRRKTLELKAENVDISSWFGKTTALEIPKERWP